MIYCQASVIYNVERLTFDISRPDKPVISLIGITFMIELEFGWHSFSTPVYEWAVNSHVNVFKTVLSILTEYIGVIVKKSLLIIMQECRFEFDTGCCYD